MYLEKISDPNQLKKLNIDEMQTLAQEMRAALMEKLSVCGGHVGPNLGFVEATIALHYVFNSPVDKFVFDVSHQSYPHKMLTGRNFAYLDAERFHEVSGYTNPQESPHDMFNVGHTSTSVSLATGLAKARDLRGGSENIVAVIGDGSLSGGEALEGLDFAGQMDSNLIVVVNDNGMSIAENHGGIYKNLRELRESGGKCGCNLFKAMGLDYVYLDDGNDIEALIRTFSAVKDCVRPVAVHINTQKGKGFKLAEQDKERWHWSVPFDKNTGEPYFEAEENCASLTADFLLDKMKKDSSVIVVAAGTPASIGFDKTKREMAGRQFADVGIAEEHAVAMVSGIAKNGGKPIFATYSSFIQRTYDQLSQDLSINGSPATILISGASVYAMNDMTHLGIFDIPLISNIPDIVHLAPTSKAEYFAMLDWSIEQDKHPVVIRIPVQTRDDGRTPDADYGEINKFKVEKVGEKVVVFAVGGFYGIGADVCRELEKHGVNATLVNPRFVSGLDTDLLDELKKTHSVAITLEDGILNGGFGEKIASYYGADDIKVKNYGLEKKFYDRFDADDVLRENGITADGIACDIMSIIR